MIESTNTHNYLISEIQNYSLNLANPIHQSFFKKFKTLDFPNKKNENYKYTKIKEEDFQDIQIIYKGINHYIFSNPIIKLLGQFPYKITFVDGLLNTDYTSLPEGIKLSNQLSLKQHNIVEELIDDRDYFSLLNNLGAKNSFLIEIEEKNRLGEAIGLFHITTENFINHISMPNLFIEAGEKSYANFFEGYLHDGSANSNYLTNSSLFFNLNENSVIDLNKLQLENANSTHIESVHAKLSKSAVFNTQLITLGGRNSRDNYKILLTDKDARANLFGLYDLDRSNQADNFIDIIHQHPQTYSHQLFKGILKDTSHGVFTGKVTIQENAKHSVSTQLNKNLILDKFAEITTRPQLEIGTDDVKCTHGATTGEMDKDQLFYLKSRGIQEEHAKRMLYHAFSREVIEASPCGKVKQILNNFFLNHANNNIIIADNSERCGHGIFNYK